MVGPVPPLFDSLVALGRDRNGAHATATGWCTRQLWVSPRAPRHQA